MRVKHSAFTKGLIIMITIEHIKKNYKKTNVLTDVCLETSEGKCIGILGSNGSGKSTLFSILAGVLKADGGSFTYNGIDMLSNEKERSKILGYVPQSTPLFEELTAIDNLRLWYSKGDLQYQLDDGVLAMLGVTSFINTPVYKMSGGMKKRLAIGCAVAHKPKILLLDEPSAALDLVCKERISNYLLEYKEKGGTILLATHDIQEIPLCDKLYILKEGVLHPYQYDGNVHRLAGNL